MNKIEGQIHSINAQIYQLLLENILLQAAKLPSIVDFMYLAVRIFWMSIWKIKGLSYVVIFHWASPKTFLFLVMRRKTKIRTTPMKLQRYDE